MPTNSSRHERGRPSERRCSMKTKNQQGFTLIELVLVITILGILAVAALPSFIDVSTQASQASRDGVVGAVRSGIALFRANDLVLNGAPGNYPATLDDASNGQADITVPRIFFTGPTTCPANMTTCSILQQGVADGSWSKTDLVYTFDDGTATYAYTYVPATGAFTSPTAP